MSTIKPAVKRGQIPPHLSNATSGITSATTVAELVTALADLILHIEIQRAKISLLERQILRGK